MLEILIPLSQLFDMFEAGVRIMKSSSIEERKPSKHSSKNGSDSHKGGSICKFFWLVKICKIFSYKLT